ncbi:hypothetical protein NCS55_01468300 [Fusarium keratoplasticum]|nr:hypothetical protein NCS55_01468300 [Fusarium keratoplasticum]
MHLAINIIATGILGSSNFFMQTLVAPTRREVDRAHSSGDWVEIGVQSIRNFRFISRCRIAFWLLFALSSVPLHLIFNGCVVDSKATNGFKVVMVAESFLDGDPFTVPGVMDLWNSEYFGPHKTMNKTITDIYQSVSQPATGNWERMAFQDCMRRYNDLYAIMAAHRHVVMVVSNDTETSSTGWTRDQVLKDTANFDDSDSVNTLWWQQSFQRTGNGVMTSNTQNTENEYISDPREDNGLFFSAGALDPTTGRLTMSEGAYHYEFQNMQVQYCLSEKFQAPCRLSINNSLLLVVCVMCGFKCFLCILTLTISIWGQEQPLITPGDAIASFIAVPGSETKGLCTLSAQDLEESKRQSSNGLRNIYATSGRSRRWQTASRRKAGNAIPRNIWTLSYLLIGSSLILGAAMFVLAIREQSIGASRFAHHPANVAVIAPGLETRSFAELTMIANTPQLILSICYMAYNGLLTRMLAEFEWSRYSVAFQSLRVTHPRGQQRSTYRLQLPYRWSIPLLAVSGLLHWVYSNCFYVSNYEYRDPEWPYGVWKINRGLQFSTVAIFIGLATSISVALSPVVVAMFRLPGNMVLGASNSKVISAACHCIPIMSTDASPNSSVAPVEDTAAAGHDADILEKMATRKLKWGQVSSERSEGDIGHLAFGVEEQEITEPIEGKPYRG